MREMWAMGSGIWPAFTTRGRSVALLHDIPICVTELMGGSNFVLLTVYYQIR